MVLAIGTVSPNLSFAPANFTLRVAHPRGPDTMEVWPWCLVDKATPPEVRAEMRRHSHSLLEQRVRRLQTTTAWAENPPSRTRRLITNVRISPVEGGEIKARCNFLVFRSRLELEEDSFFGTRRDRLRRVDGVPRIARRKIIYDAAVSGAENLSMLL